MLNIKADTKRSYYDKFNIDEHLDDAIIDYLKTGNFYDEIDNNKKGIEATQERISKLLGVLTNKLREKNILSDKDVFDLIEIDDFYVGQHNFRIE